MKQRGLVCGLVQSLVDSPVQGLVGTEVVGDPPPHERLLDTDFTTGAPWTVVSGRWSIGGGAYNLAFGIPGAYQDITEIPAGTQMTLTANITETNGGLSGLRVNGYYQGVVRHAFYSDDNAPATLVQKVTTSTWPIDRITISVGALSDMPGTVLASISLFA